jgi:hypothetical protein
MSNSPLKTALIGLAFAGAVAAQGVVNVSADITTSTTWTSNNVYNLTRQVYVRNGATLTIQAGTVVATTATPNGSGALAVTRGSQIFVQGTQCNPVIMTSDADRATWVNGDPKTGTYRQAANEWGNLTVMGNAYISEDAVAGNTATPNAANSGVMEGLLEAFPGDTRVHYGGGNDDDDSGSIAFCSIRYAGRVVGLNNELNGLSLGGIGRETDIHHVEIMNNVDDGVEVWGGTVNFKYLSIWNVGDDSFDIDQGWRGKAQFVLIVQGYSVDAAQGSGVGDNAIEHDGAEDSDYQPVTTGVIYNATVIGQPSDGDHGTAWRDGCRMQYRNCIFTDIGEAVVRNDNVDGDGGSGYGHNGTATYASLWSTPYSTFSAVNAPANPAAFYAAQTSGNLAEIKDSVFYNNLHSSAYTEATARGVFAPANNNVQEPASSPITSVTRAAPITVSGKVMRQVTFLDPRPAADALTSVSWAPNDGFFCGARYRGAFAPGNNWLCCWTASEAYGLTNAAGWCDLGKPTSGITGAPVLAGSGTLTAGQPITLALSNARPNSPTVFFVSPVRTDLALFGLTIIPDLVAGASAAFSSNANGGASLGLTWPAGINGTVYYQTVIFDPSNPFNFAASNGVSSNN